MATIVNFASEKKVYDELERLGYKRSESSTNAGIICTCKECDLMDVVANIFYNTNLNVMIQHSGTENTIIYIDTKRFYTR